MTIFYMQIISLVTTLATIYVVLKWYKFGFVKKTEPHPNTDGEVNEESLREFYHQNNLIRGLLLLLAVVANALAYFFANYTGGAYLGVMLLLCVPFLFTKK